MLTEYVHRKSREKDGRLEYIEVKKIFKNEQLTSIKLVIGDENNKKELEMTVNEWKSLLIFFNTIKTRIEPTGQPTKSTSKPDELIEEPIEAKVPVMSPPLAKKIAGKKKDESIWGPYRKSGLNGNKFVVDDPTVS